MSNGDEENDKSDEKENDSEEQNIDYKDLIKKLEGSVVIRKDNIEDDD